MSLRLLWQALWGQPLHPKWPALTDSSKREWRDSGSIKTSHLHKPLVVSSSYLWTGVKEEIGTLCYGYVRLMFAILLVSSAELGLPPLPCFQLRVRDDTPTDMIACKHRQPHNSQTHTRTRTHAHNTRTVFSLSYMQSVTNTPGQLHPFLWQPWWITLPLLALIKDERGDGHTPGAWHGLISLILTHTHVPKHRTAV